MNDIRKMQVESVMDADHHPVCQFFQKPGGIAMAAFMVAYCIGFVFPVFFHAERFHFYDYLPAAGNLGLDFMDTLNAASQTDRIPYSPLAKIIFQLLRSIPWPISYYLLTLLTLFSLCFACYLIIPELSQRRDRSLITLLFLSVLFSYGFQFEMERGQWNLITMVLIFS